MTKNNAAKFSDELLDQLLAGRDPSTALDSGGLIDDLRKALAERIDARHSRFDPALLREYCQRFPGFDDKIVALYARGIGTWDIQRHVHKIYDIDISPALVSAVTDSVLDEVITWQVRPLEPSYAIVFFDALRVKIRDQELVKDKTVYIAIGVDASGQRQVLGSWVEESEGSSELWLQVMSEIKARGTQDILIAVVDGLEGSADAISAVFPNTVVQTCILHLIRCSMDFAPWERRKSIAYELASIYSANTAASAAVALEFFALDNCGRKYPAIAESWRQHWEAVIPFFSFPAEVREVIYTHNAIESLNASVRRAVRNKGHFLNDRAATKLIWLALRNIAESWKKAPVSWKKAKAKLAIRFEGRFVLDE